MKYYLYCTFLCLGLLAVACSREAMEPETGSLSVQLNNVVGKAELAMNGTIYTNIAGEAFTVNKFDYFVSNIRLRKADGSEFVPPQDSSYFLVREADAVSQTLRLNNIPLDQYIGLSFVVGVDSLRSVSGIEKRKGALDPGDIHTAGMYWDWNTGYIFLKLEGTSPVTPVNATGNNNFQFHIGLFGGYRAQTINNLRTVSLTFGGQSIQPATTGSARIQVQADVQKVFEGSTRISLAKTPEVMVSNYSATIANNYATMFSFVSLTKTAQ